MFQQNTGIHIRQLIESRETNFDEWQGVIECRNIQYKMIY
jgi:hypothetical protein